MNEITGYTVVSSYGMAGTPFTITDDFPKWEARLLALEKARSLSAMDANRGILFHVLERCGDGDGNLIAIYRNGIADSYERHYGSES